VIDYLKSAAGRHLLKEREEHRLYIESGYDVGTKTHKQPDFCLQDKNGKLIASFDLKVKIDPLKRRTTKEHWWGKTHWKMVQKYDQYHCILKCFAKKSRRPRIEKPLCYAVLR
jgi:hypothetical protein